MSDKISPIAVIKESLAVAWARKWAFLSLAVAGLVVTLIPAAFIGGVAAPIPEGSDPGFPVFPLVAFLFQLAGYWVLATLFFHLIVTHLRGNARLVPDRFPATLARVVGRTLQLHLIQLLVTLVTMGPLIAFAAYTFQDGTFRLDDVPHILFIVLFICAWFANVLVTTRLSVMLPAAAIDSGIGLKKVFALTRGHAWRMFASFALVCVVLVLCMALVTVLSVTVPADPLLSGPALVSMFLFWVIMFPGALVVLSLAPVWYERLRLRMAGLEGGTGFEFAPEPASEPAPESPLPAVGPYVDRVSE